MRVRFNAQFAKARMDALGIPSWNELARQAGIHLLTIHYVKTGKAVPKVDTLKRIADVLGCLVDDLILVEYEDAPSSREPIADKS